MQIHLIFVGQPRTLRDEQGEWRSSIYRDLVSGPIELGLRGLADDRVTDTTYHGSPDQAVCCHPIDHYAYWNEVYDLPAERWLGPGSVGENWTLVGADEGEICAGDIYAVGSAQVQVRGSRMPCSKQNRKLGLSDFQQRTQETLRTGFYLGVLRPGIVQAGDELTLLARPNPGLTLRAINASTYGEVDVNLADRLLAAQGIDADWKTLFQRKLAKR